MQDLFHMVLWEHVICREHEKGRYTLDDTMTGESHLRIRQFWRGGSDPRRYHGIAPLDKWHYNVLVPQFWLQFSRILLWINKNSFNP